MKLSIRTILVVLLSLPLLAVEPVVDQNPLVVHEWGTFTSVASENGAAVKWAPLSGPSDLPCFVEQLGPPGFKDIASGLVRMETPVLYFYSPKPVSLSVRVAFPQGWITEWYPHASAIKPDSVGTAPVRSYSNGEIRWDRIDVSPGTKPVLPASKGASHYFAARETDSAPLRIGSEWEKLIFYRGVGNFEVPLRPTLTPEGRLKIVNTEADAVPLAILFENRDGKIGYRIAHGVKGATEIVLPELGANLDTLRAELASQLAEFGLYKKEALAMVETWRDSWFEEGMRVFYILPRTMVDTVLPLEVKPAPSSTARVFVGRIELLSPGMQRTIETAAAAGDMQRLAKIGRFLGPFVTQMERTNPGRPRPWAVQSVFRQPPPAPSCVQ